MLTCLNKKQHGGEGGVIAAFFLCLVLLWVPVDAQWRDLQFSADYSLDYSGYSFSDYEFSDDLSMYPLSAPFSYDFSFTDFSGSGYPISTPTYSFDFSGYPAFSLTFSHDNSFSDSISIPAYSFDLSMNPFSLGFSHDYSFPFSDFSGSVPAASYSFDLSIPTDLSLELSYNFDFSYPFSFHGFSHSYDSSYQFSSDLSYTEIPTELPTAVPTFTPTFAPTEQPTAVPTFTPTEQPSEQPTYEPTTLPTLAPSASPSFVPTLSPTLSTTLSQPTRFPSSTPSKRPTSQPTASPTFSLHDRWRAATDAFVKSYPLTETLRSVFTEVYTVDSSAQSCSNWNNFLAADILSKLIVYDAKKITLAGVQDNYATLNKTAISCDIPASAIAIATAFKTSSTQVVKCGSNDWVIAGKCGSSGKPALCLNCTNPCLKSSSVYTFSCNGTHTNNFAKVLFVDFSPQNPPPTINSIAVNASSSTSIHVQAFVSAASGSLVCAAYLSSLAYTPSSVGILATQGSLKRITSTSVSYSIANLVPGTSYDVFCATYSSYGFPSGLNTVVSATVSTGCCRQVKVSLLSSAFTEIKDVPNALVINAGNYPPVDLTLSVSADYQQSVSSSSGVKTPFSPATWTLNSNSIRQQNFAYLKNPSGIYNLTVALSGASAATYEVVFTTGKSFLVIGGGMEPKPPKLLSAQFSDDGTRIIVSFDSATDKGGYVNSFSCDALFNLKSSIKCQWTNDQVLTISASGDSGLSIDDPITLKANLLKAKCILTEGCNSWSYAPASEVAVIAPVSPIIPTVKIVGPVQIGPCDNMQLDITGSTGSGGRAWSSVEFDIESSTTNTSRLVAYLDAVSDFNRKVVIPAGYFNVNNYYNIIVTMCNFLGRCGTNSLQVTVSSVGNVPVASVTPSKVKRSQALSVLGYASVAECGGKLSTKNLVYSWQLYQGSTLLSGDQYKSTSVDPRLFRLAPYALSIGTLYNVIFTATSTQYGTYSSSSTTVSVSSGTLTPRLSTGTSVGLRKSENLVIDASSSVDENINYAGGEINANLVYTFTCTTVSPYYSESCYLDIETISSTSIKIIPRSLTNVSDIYSIQVTMQDTYDFRSASTSTLIKILPDGAPKISLTSGAESRPNPSSKLKLLATVDFAYSGNVTWNVDDASVNLATTSLSPVAFDITTSPNLAKRISASLVLPPNTLHAGSAYLFQIQCRLRNGFFSSATLEIITNSPPQPGVFLVSPPSGEAFFHKFDFQAATWEDDDFPLTFEFSFQSLTGEYLVLRSRGTQANAQSILSAGSAVNNYNVSTRLAVFDGLNANTVVDSIVRVIASETSTDQLSDLLANSDPDELAQNAAAVSEAINSVDCSQAPDCIGLNREVCAYVKNTCGKCLDGYLGAEGASNSQCVLPSEINRNLRSLSTPQECTNDCSGHGTCTYISKYDPEETVVECFEFDPGCKAVCSCSAGYAGSYCQFTSEELEDLQELRGQLVDALQYTISTSDASEENIVSYINTLSSISPEADGLSSSAQSTMKSLVLDILSYAKNLQLSYDSVSTLNDVLNLLLSGAASAADRRRLQSSVTLSQFVSLLNDYGTFIMEDMSNGQNPVEVLQQEFKMSVNSLSGASKATVTMPLSTLEQYAGLNPQSIVLPAHVNAEEWRTFLLEVNHLASPEQGLPLSVYLEESPCGLDSAELSCNSTIELVNLPVPPSDPEIFEHVCHTGVVEDVTHTCDVDSQVVTISCDGATNALVKQPCPTISMSYDCESITTGYLDYVNVECVTLSVDEEKTVCQCSLPGDQNERHMMVSAATTKSYTSYDEIYEDLPIKPDESDGSWDVLITICAATALILVYGIIGWVMEQKQNTSEAKTDASLSPIWKSGSSFATRAVEELFLNHKWFNIVNSVSRPEKSRVVRVIGLYFHVLVEATLLCLVYNLSDAKDEHCEERVDRDACLKPDSFLALGGPMCRWEDGTGVDDGECYYRSPKSDSIRMLFAGIFTAILTSFAMPFVEVLINHAATPRRAASEISPMLSGSRSSKGGGGSIDSDSLSEDEFLTKLQAELENYQRGLDQAERSAFRDAWRLNDADQRFLRQKVKQVKAEAANETRVSGYLHRRNQTKRLTYLFAKDFLVGADRRLLEAKEDKFPIPEAAGRTGFVAIFLLVVGLIAMFSYTVVFSWRQSADRQIAWYTSFIIFFIFEVVVVETLSVLVTDVILPLGRYEVIKDAINKVYELMNQQNQPTNPSNSSKKGVDRFDMTSFLFVSRKSLGYYQTADANSQLIRAVGSFSTVWPVESFCAKGLLGAEPSSQSGLTAGYLSLPRVLQDVVRYFLISASAGWYAILLFYLGRINPGYPFIAIAALVVFLIGGVLVCVCGRKLDRRSMKVAVQATPLTKTEDKYTPEPVAAAPQQQQQQQTTEDQEQPPPPPAAQQEMVNFQSNEEKV